MRLLGRLTIDTQNASCAARIHSAQSGAFLTSRSLDGVEYSPSSAPLCARKRTTVLEPDTLATVDMAWTTMALAESSWLFCMST